MRIDEETKAEEKKLMETLIGQFGTATALVNEYARGKNETDKKRLLVSMSRVKNGKGNLPAHFLKWMGEQIRLRKWGSIHIQQDEQTPIWFLDLIELYEEGNVIKVLHIANEIDGNAKVAGIEDDLVYIRLSAFLGTLYFELGEKAASLNRLGEAFDFYSSARDAYDECCDRAKRGAPHYHNKYITSYLNALREVYLIEFKLNLISQFDYHQKLIRIMNDQWEVIDSSNTKNETDQYIGLKHIMRISAILNNEDDFTEAFNDATTDGFIGKPQEDLEREVYFWMKHDQTGDFRNAFLFKSAFEDTLKRPDFFENNSEESQI